MKTPVLFLLFNRPDTTQRVFEAIRAARPPRLYVAADGPRGDRGEAEAELCRQTRALVVDHIDWPCEVHTLFHDQNLGCGLAPYTAMQWFFDHEPEGIILEDDCLPHPDFFEFCAQMLEKYRHHAQIKVIAGTNYDFYEKQTAESYYFSAFPIIGAWAGWRRTWDGYVFDLGNLRFWDYYKSIRFYFSRIAERLYWLYMFLRIKSDILQNDCRISFWDYQLTMAIWKSRGLCIIPNRSTIQNIGFRPDATHTTVEDPLIAGRAPESIYPLVEPRVIAQNKTYDNRYVMGRLYWRRLPLSLVKLWVNYIWLKLKKR